MARKTNVPTSLGIRQNAEKTYRKFMLPSMLRKLGLGEKPAYFFVYGVTLGGKTVYWGPIPRDEADACAVGLINGEVFEMNIRDLKKATQAIKAELLRRGTDPDKALSRLSHTGFKEFLADMRSK